MDRGTRISLIKRVAAHLDAELWPNMNLTLQVFGFEPLHPDNNSHETTYEVLLHDLREGTEQALLELHAYLFPDDPQSLDRTPAVAVPWKPGDFRLFISHTTAHKTRASRLSKTLEPWGVQGFVAHEDVEPTADWKDVIVAAMHSCDAMCALLTPDFQVSPWCDQECGLAIARGLTIVPVDLGAKPYGFIRHLQALAAPEGSPLLPVVDDIFMALAKNRLTRSAMTPHLVRRLEVDDHPEGIPRLLALLQALPTDAWTDPMIDGLRRAVTANPGLREATLADGSSARESAAELANRVGPVAPSQSADDDIPF